MIHFHILLSKRGQKPVINYKTSHLLEAKEALKDVLRNQLKCTKQHNYHDIKCYSFDVPCMTAKIAENHEVHGHSIDRAEVFDCDEVRCYKKMKM